MGCKSSKPAVAAPVAAPQAAKATPVGTLPAASATEETKNAAPATAPAAAAKAEAPAAEAKAEALKNTAFLFIKPHAMTQGVKDLAAEMLAASGINVLRSGQIEAQTIDKDGLIDTHYGAIASRAIRQKASELLVQPHAQAEFEKVFGLSWEDALSKGLIYNAAEASAKLGVEPLVVSARFDKLQRGKDQVKCGGGFYVGKLGDIFVVNGFYTAMRAKYTTPPACIQYFEVDFDPAKLSWADFRAKVVGATNPAEAEKSSIRSAILQRWEELGLKSCPDTGDNGLHASASPFEGLAERVNWLGLQVAQDPHGRALLESGLKQETLEAWFGDCEVLVDGKKRGVFDALEDLDVGTCLERARAIISETSAERAAGAEKAEEAKALVKVSAPVEEAAPAEAPELAVESAVVEPAAGWFACC